MRATILSTVLLLAIAGTLAATASKASAAVIWYDCTDCPLSVPPSGTSGTTTSVLDIGDHATIHDLDVFINLTHTFTGDLEISLQAPNGTEVLMFENEGGSGDDITDVTFDDEAVSSISGQIAPFGPGTFRPSPGSLSDFDGLDVFGQWTLIVNDELGGDSGRLNHWSIHVETPVPATLLLMGVGLAALGIGRRRQD